MGKHYNVDRVDIVLSEQDSRNCATARTQSASYGHCCAEAAAAKPVLYFLAA